MSLQFLTPNWRVHPRVHACMTTRIAGVSSDVYGQINGAHGLNLATHVGDEHAHVMANRELLRAAVYLPGEPLWLNQTHSTIVYVQTNNGYQHNAPPPEADAVVLTQGGQVGVVMTADCLPVVLGNADGSEVANLHAGWRGLAGGIVENTIAEMRSKPTWAWLGAAISQPCFEVGTEVKDAFCSKYAALATAFQEGEQAGKYYADLYAIARFILNQQGVATVLGGDQCSYRQEQDYYSYRRHAKTGRMATFVFMA